MNCPNCGAQLIMEEYHTDFYHEDTIILTEHHWCPECNKRYERIATYEIAKEQMNEET